MTSTRPDQPTIASSSAGAPLLAGRPRLRLALCATDIEIGGAERALVELATGLDPARFEVAVYSLADEPSDRQRSLAPRLRAAGLNVHTLAARRTRDGFGVLRRLTQQWRAFRPDVVQTFLFHANLVGRLAARRAGVQHVVCGIRVAEQRARWRLWADRWTDRAVERHVCVSQAVADFSRAVGGLPADKLLVIPNGIDVTRYDSAQPTTAAELGVPAGRRWITYVGRLDPQKNLPWLIAGAAEWLAQAKEHDLILVGDGPLRTALAAQLRELELEHRIHLVGWRSDVPGILAASDLLVLPSHWEGMPNVLLEAMASRRPVLATDVEGVRELLGDQASMQTVAPGDQVAWRNQLLRLASDRELAQHVGAANRKCVEANFTLRAMVQAYAALYESLVA